MKGNELKQAVVRSLEDLAQMADEARATVIREWLLFQARFHKYSSYNTWLIRIQRPDATFVAGYRKWQEMGRQVRKGEKGIAILVPRPYRKEYEKVDPETGETVTETVEGVYFVTGYVFDISQTDGDPLPDKPPVVPVGDDGKGLTHLLETLAARKGIAVETRKLGRGQHGVSLGGQVVLDSTLSPLGRASVLAHEIAHEVLHRNGTSREVAEVEAEAVAFVVLAHFGYQNEAARYLTNYVAIWDQHDGVILRARMERIADAARAIIEDLEALAEEQAAAHGQADQTASQPDRTDQHDQTDQPDQSSQPTRGLTRAEILRRWERAAQALHSGDYRVQREGTRRFIVSNGDGKQYTVSFEDNPTGACDCPDYQKRGGPCKHVAMAVMMAWPQAADRWLARVGAA